MTTASHQDPQNNQFSHLSECLVPRPTIMFLLFTIGHLSKYLMKPYKVGPSEPPSPPAPLPLLIYK